MLVCCSVLQRRVARRFVLAIGSLAAAGSAGCAGSGMFTTAPGSQSVFDRIEVAAAADGVGRARVSLEEPDVRPVRRSLWGRRSQIDLAAVDPFAEAHGPVTSSATMPVDSGSAVDPRTAATVVRSVAHAESEGAGSAVTAAESEQRIGRARVNDHRLPPAAPLGAANPFALSRRDAGTAVTSPGHVTAKPTFVSNRRHVDDGPAAQVPHDDMIVDSAAVPQRAVWRTGTQLRPDMVERKDFSVIPRRPFTSSDSEAAPIATANVPVAITDAYDDETVFSAASYSFEPKVPAPGTPGEAPAPPLDDPDAAPEFTETPPLFADVPLDAPAEPEPSDPSLLIASAGGLDVAPPPPAVKAVAEAKPSKLAIYSGMTSVKPIEISEGDRAAAEQVAARSILALNRPVMIGVALVCVASGVVFLRRRFF